MLIIRMGFWHGRTFVECRITFELSGWPIPNSASSRNLTIVMSLQPKQKRVNNSDVVKDTSSFIGSFIFIINPGLSISYSVICNLISFWAKLSVIQSDSKVPAHLLYKSVGSGKCWYSRTTENLKLLYILIKIILFIIQKTTNKILKHKNDNAI